MGKISQTSSITTLTKKMTDWSLLFEMGVFYDSCHDYFPFSFNCIFMIHVVQYNAPVNILPARGGGGHTRGFRQKTIPDRREFDKLMESGSRVI